MSSYGITRRGLLGIPGEECEDFDDSAVIPIFIGHYVLVADIDCIDCICIYIHVQVDRCLVFILEKGLRAEG